MNKYLTAFMAGMFLLSFGQVSAEESDSANMTVMVDIFKTKVGISVPDKIHLGTIAKGYASETKTVEVENIGTTDISLTPELFNDTDELFSFLNFKRIQADPFTRIGFFDLLIERPTIVGDTRSENLYMELDLTNYQGDIDTDSLDQESVILFTAMAS